MSDAAASSAELFTLDQVSLVRDGRTILDGVTDHIHEGRATALVGPSGSGKTTLLRMLNRLEEPTGGSIHFRGTDVRSLGVHELRRRVGLLGQHPIMLTASVRDEVAFAKPSLSMGQIEALLQRVGLEDFPLDRSTTDLSGGEQQRLALARALAVEPEVLLLDEPTSALDPRAAEAVDVVVRSLVSDGLTVVLVSHDLNRAATISDDALVLEQGRVVDRGDPRTVRYISG
jgi:putative ABC transport system ATP-binding protein